MLRPLCMYKGRGYSGCEYMNSRWGIMNSRWAKLHAHILNTGHSKFRKGNLCSKYVLFLSIFCIHPKCVFTENKF